MRLGPTSPLQSQMMLTGCGSSGSGSVPGPLDEVPGALAAWGLVPLSAAMIGQNGFRLQKTSGGATQDFAFADGSTPVADVVSWKGADAAYNNLAASFETIYDQVGTNHLTQTTQTAQPSWLVLPDGNAVAAMDGNNRGRSTYWSIPNMSLNGRNVTIYHVFRGNGRSWSGGADALGVQHPNFGWTGGGNFFGLSGGLASYYKPIARTWRGGGNFDDNVSTPSNCHLQVQAVRFNGSSTTYSLNDKVVLATGIPANVTLTDGAIGRLSTFEIYSPGCQWLATVIYPAQSDAEMTATFAALRAKFELAAWTENHVFDGDSITAGHTVNEGAFDVRYNAWPSDYWAFCADPSKRFSNTAISSQTLATMETNAALKVDPLFDASFASNQLYIFGGTNDINAGASGATTFSRLQTYIASRIAAHAWDQIYVFTAIPRENFSGSQNTELAAYNAAILADASGDFTVVDIAAEAWAFGTHYQGTTPNRIHPNSAGRSLLLGAFPPPPP